MAILHVRNVPDKLYERLKQRARTRRRSLSVEVLELLERGIDDLSEERSVLLERIDRRREALREASGEFDSTTWIREDRER